MAFNFIKKVFSFGKDKEDAPAPDAVVETPDETAAAGATDTAPETTPPEQAFPADGDMQFTPETAPGEEAHTPVPADEQHAGEPPIPTDAGTKDATSEQGGIPADAAVEALPPEEITSDPDVPAAPVPTPGPVDQEHDGQTPVHSCSSGRC